MEREAVTTRIVTAILALGAILVGVVVAATWPDESPPDKPP